MPKTAGSIVTEYDLATTFTPKSGVTPGSDDTRGMSGNQVNTRYHVTGAPATEELVFWDELSSAIGTISYTFSKLASVAVVFSMSPSTGGTLTYTSSVSDSMTSFTGSMFISVDVTGGMSGRIRELTVIKNSVTVYDESQPNYLSYTVNFNSTDNIEIISRVLD